MGGVLQFEELDGNIGLLTFDIPDQNVNTLSSPVLRELSQHVDDLEQRPDLQGLLLQSGKAGQFIAGADLKELESLAGASAEQVERGVAAGHDLFARISQLPFPTVALIDGACMGGGTELVLALDVRIVSDNPKTRIALPEVNVGLIPGWGGTQRLPRLVGIHHAINMITTGELVAPEKAVSIGLAFDAVAADQLIDEGLRLISQLQGSGDWKQRREQLAQPLGLSEDQWNFTFAVTEGQVMGKTRGQYPAPLMAVRAMKEGINLPLEEGLQVERTIAREIMRSPTAANLIGLFFRKNSVSRDPGINSSEHEPRSVGRVGVLGAGLMGAGIAAAHARRGIAAAMVDIDNDRLAAGISSARHVVESRISIGRATPDDLAEMLGLLSTSVSHQIFSDCDVVIEAVTENEELKTSLYGQLAGVQFPSRAWLAPHRTPNGSLVCTSFHRSIGWHWLK